jgi:hypothetical protein
LATKTWDGGGTTGNWSEAANWSDDAVPTAGDPVVIFDGTSTKSATIDANVTVASLQINSGYTGTISQGASNVTIGGAFSQSDGTYDSGTGILSFGVSHGHAQSAGNFVCGTGTVTFDGGTFTQAGGTFDCSVAAALNLNFIHLVLNGGTFNAPDAVMNYSGGSFERNGGTFTSNGTMVFDRYAGPLGSASQVVVDFDGVNPGSQTFFNVTFSAAVDPNGRVQISAGDTINVLGTLRFADGDVDSLGTGAATAVIQAEGNVLVDPTYGNGNADVTGTALLKLVGNATRTITIPSNLPGNFNPIELNAPNTTVTFSGSGTAGIERLSLLAGTINTGATAFSFADARANTQSGGTFTCGSGTLGILQGSYTLRGGSFNCGAAIAMNFSSSVLTLNGGTFTAPSGTLNFNGSLNSESLTINNGAIFAHHDGTVVFNTHNQSCCTTLLINGDNPGTVEFSNLSFNLAGTNTVAFIGDGDTLRVFGTLSFIDGLALRTGGGAPPTIEAHGDVTIAPTFDGGTTAIAFRGTGNQTFTNNGGASPSGTWTIDKTGGVVTAATNLSLATSQTLNVTSGTLYLNNNSNLTTGPLFVGANGRLVNESATTITLGGNVSNLGVIDLQGGGAGCPESDTILIRSSDATQRSWTGSGRYRLVDVDVQRMGGTGTKTVFSGTDSFPLPVGSNNPTWVFNAGPATSETRTPCWSWTAPAICSSATTAGQPGQSACDAAVPPSTPAPTRSRTPAA